MRVVTWSIDQSSIVALHRSRRLPVLERLGSVVGQQLAGERPGDEVPQLENTDS